MGLNRHIRHRIGLCAPANLLRAATGVLLPGILIGPAVAGQSRAFMPVNATVMAVAHMQGTSLPAQFLLSAADLQRGYVDVPQPASFVVNSNSATGFQLDVIALNPMISNIVVAGLDSPQVLGADGGTLVQRWNGPQSRRLTLRFRIVLAPGAVAGRYPWPLRMSVRPL